MKRRKKILHIIRSLDRGGCENMLLRTLPLLTNFKHVILTLDNEGEMVGDFLDKGIEIRCLKRQWWKLIKVVKQIDPDVVVTYLFHADFLGRTYLRPLTKYRPIPYLRTTYNFPRYKWVRLFERLTSFMVSAYLANSNSVKDYYVKNMGVEANKITVIPNGIDLRKYNLSNIWREEFREALSVGNNDVVITCVANFHPNKGHKYLLKVFAKTLEKKKNIWLWLIGDGENRKEIEEIANSLNIREKVIFWGKRSDVPDLLKSTDIFTLLTSFEGMSNAVLEAMASGIPVLVSDIAENRELVGRSGVLVSMDNIDTVSDELIKLVVDSCLRKRMGVELRSVVEKHHQIDLVIDRLSQFFMNLVSIK